MVARLLEIQAITPTRVGAGRGLGHVDLPVVREKVTNYPYVPGTAIKGVLSDKYTVRADHNVAFGQTDAAGSLVFTDAKLLAMPVLSFYGTFALVTCPTILRRLQMELRSFGSNVALGDIPEPANNALCALNNTRLKPQNAQNVYLLDVDFSFQTLNVNLLFQLSQLFSSLDASRQQRFAVVSDDAFAFLCQTGTEVNAHIRIDDASKTVSSQALWYEETMPPETLFYGFVYCDRVYRSNQQNQPDPPAPADLMDAFCPDNSESLLQFGGKSSTGKGRCFCRFHNLNGGAQ